MGNQFLFLTGILSLLQVLCLPGLILRRYLRLPDSILLQSVFVFGLSLTVNYTLGFFFTALGFFTRPVVFAVVMVEMIWLAIIYLPVLVKTNLDAVSQSIIGRVRNAVALLKPGKWNDQALVRLLYLVAAAVLLILAVTSLEWASRYIRYNVGSVFNTWDTILSWNRWSVEWANNRIPIDTEDYAQLIPINWAWMFLLVGSTRMQLFAQGLMPAFTFAMLMALFGYAVYKKQPGYLAAVFVLRVLIKKFQDNYISAGYVDLPLAFMALLAILALHDAWTSEDQRTRRSRSMLALVLASGAAVTKQPGLIILAVVLLAVAYLMLGKRANRTVGLAPIAAMLLPPAVITLPWYAYSFSKYFSGQADTHLFIPYQQSVTGSDERTGLLAKLSYGFSTLGVYQFLFLALLPAALLLERFWQMLTLFVVLPYTLLWAGYANYDVRNLVMIFPLAAIAIGLALWRLSLLTLNLVSGLKLGKAGSLILVILMLVVMVGAGLLVKDQVLMERQESQQRTIFSPEINAYLHENLLGQPVRILSNYPVSSQPGFEDAFVKFWFDDVEHMKSIITAEKVTHLLVPAVAEGDVNAFIDEQLAAGKYKLLFENTDFIRYRLIAVDPDL